MPICATCANYRADYSSPLIIHKCRINKYKEHLKLRHPENDGEFPFADIECSRYVKNIGIIVFSKEGVKIVE